ncbi:unnamed protein product, partial [Timema podura]|nr:unnamed protein product [Timema podura]
MEKAPLKGNVSSLQMNHPSSYQSVDDQVANGHPTRSVSLSSDEDMIDITTTGTVTERSIHNDELNSAHC